MRESERLMKNTAFLGIASVVSKGISFLFMPFLTSYLSPAEFGAAEIVMNTALLLLPFVSLYAPEMLFRFLVSEEDKSAVVTVSAFFAALGTAVFLLLFPLTALVPFLRAYRYYLLCYVPASIFHSFFTHWLRAEGNYRSYAAFGIVSTALTVLLQVLMLGVFRLGVGGYLSAIILADFAVGLVLLFKKRPWQFLKMRFVFYGKAREMTKYALPLIPAATVTWITAHSNRYFLLYYHGNAATGVYAAAGRIPALFTLLLGMFLEAWHYSAVRVEREVRARIFSRAFRLLLPLAATLCGFFMLVAMPLVGLLLHADYSGASTPLLFLLAGAFCSALSGFLGSAYSVTMQTEASLFTSLAGAAFNVILNLLLIPPMGLLGAALAVFFAYFFLLLIRIRQITVMLHVKLEVSCVIRTVLLLLFVATAVVSGSWWSAFCAVLLLTLSFWREMREVIKYFLPFLLQNKKRQKTPTDIDN